MSFVPGKKARAPPAARAELRRLRAELRRFALLFGGQSIQEAWAVWFPCFWPFEIKLKWLNPTTL
jgi:hypothetical protein